MLDEHRLFGPAAGPARQIGAPVAEGWQPGLIEQAWSDPAVLPERGGGEVPSRRPQAVGTMQEAVADRLFGAERLIIPPDAARRPERYDADRSEWRGALESKLARVAEVGPRQPRDVGALAAAGQEALWRRTDAVLSASEDGLEDVFDGSSFVAAALPVTPATGAQAAAAWLESRKERFSTMRLDRGHAEFGFKGSADPAHASPGPGLSAHVDAPGRFPAKVGVSIGLGQEAPGFTALSDSLGALERSAREQKQTFGLKGEPSADGRAPDASGGQGAAGRMRLSLADQYGANVKWWLALGLLREASSGARPAGDIARDQPAEVDAGVHYDLGPDVALAAEYGYHDRTDLSMAPFRAPADGQRSDEQLHTARLRLIWRFTTSTEAGATGPAGGE